ncbi:MAG: hypothetical protein ACFCU9_06325 [Cyanophyceae cyanobacterium]
MRLKSHESPRHQGRNDRGRGGTARKKQLDKRNRALLKKLKQGIGDQPHSCSAGDQPAFLCIALVTEVSLETTHPSQNGILTSR